MWGRRRPITVVIVLATLLGLALRGYQLSRPGYLLGVTEYDDGVDFGSAVLLVHGVLPYRDFITVQPPGITELLAPVALLGYGTGTAKALAVARMLTAGAGVASVPLGGLLVRHRGRFATAVTCGVLACHPGAVAAAHTVLLEPWLVLCCLLGALAVFDGDQLVRGRIRPGLRSRVVWGGVAFGFAGTIKVWAVLPVLVIAVLWLPAPRRLVGFLGGVVAGFVVPVLPFVALAPRRFVASVIVAQLTRIDVTRVPVPARLASLLGLPLNTPLTTPMTTPVAFAVLAVLAVLAIGGTLLVTRRPPPALDVFAVAGTGLLLAAFCWPASYYYHYAGFFAPFLALFVALPLARFAARSPARSTVTVLPLLVIAGLAVRQAEAESGLAAPEPAAAVSRAIPPGACVLTDTVSLTVAADRFVSTEPGCPSIVDGVGTDYTLSGGRNGVTGAGAVPAVESAWLDALRQARYVWLSCAPAGAPRCDATTNRRIPWTPTISGYFAGHFRPVPGVPGLYARYTDTPSAR